MIHAANVLDDLRSPPAIVLKPWSVTETAYIQCVLTDSGAYVLSGKEMEPMTLKLQTTIKPTHVGEVLKMEFMAPLGLSANALARHIGVPPNRISSVVNGSRGMTADTAIRLSQAFNTSVEFWMNLQKHYEIEVEKDRRALSNPKVIPVVPALAGADC
jgi:antitoxin HigA-1